MAFPNKFPGYCAECEAAGVKRWLKAQEGEAFSVETEEGRKWRVRCRDHEGSTDATQVTIGRSPLADAPIARPRREASGPPTVRMWLANEHVLVRPTTFLGDEKYLTFREVCRKGQAEFTLSGHCAKCNSWEHPALGLDLGVHNPCPTCKGSLTDVRNVNRAPLANVATLVRAFSDGGIEVEMTPDLRARLQAAASQAREAAAKADARIESILTALKLRGKTLWVFQQLGILFLAEHSQAPMPCALLADDMGLGKTVQLLLALGDGKRVVVVCPAVARGNWVKEARAWRPDYHAFHIEGRDALQHLPPKGRICVMSFDSLGDRVPDGFDSDVVLIADEAHNLKGSKSVRRVERWHVLKDAVAKGGGCVWGATGTPLVNDLNELWRVLEACGDLGTRIFGNARRFKKLANEDPDEFAALLKTGMLRRTKGEVLKDLPPKVFQEHPVEIDDESRRELDGLLAKIVDLAVEAALEDLRAEAKDANRELTEVQIQAAATTARMNVQAAIEHAFDGRLKVPFELISRVKSILASAKLRRSLDLLDEWEADNQVRPDGTYPDPIVFFSAHLEPVNVVASRPGWGKISGETSPDERTALIEKFQAGKLAGMALTIRAGGVAVTLTRASRELINDREWTPALNNQAYDRCHRIGQSGTDRGDGNGESVQITNVIANHALDQRISELLQEKTELNERTVERATRGADERAQSLATGLEQVVAATKLHEPTTVTFSSRRAPKGEVEPWALKVAQDAVREGTATEFVSSLASQFERGGGLSEKQWSALARWASETKTRSGEAAPGASPSPPRSSRQRWIADALLRLAGSCDGANKRDDAGFNRHDAVIGRSLALRANGAGLTLGEWRLADRILVKYRRTQVGQPPEDDPTPTPTSKEVQT